MQMQVLSDDYNTLLRVASHVRHVVLVVWQVRHLAEQGAQVA